MQTASEAFQKGNLAETISLYSDLIQQKREHWVQALLNRSSAYYTQASYLLSLKDSLLYLSTSEKPVVQGYILFANNLIKLKKIINEEERGVLARGKQEYSTHKKYIDTLKIIEQIQVTQDEQEFMDKIFQKLLSDPKIRNWMQQEPFLTKIQKMIKNPSLASALIKLDSRLADVQEIILMAEE